MGEVSKPGEQPHLIVIDDDYAMRLSCRQILTKAGYQVETFEDGAQGLDAISQRQPDLAVVDLKMPGISGMEVLARIQEIDPLINIVVITGYATIGTAVDAMKAGAHDFLPKPFTPDELRLIVKRGLERRQLEIEYRHAEMERELLKRRFVTFVSHQLKTPLVAVHQYLEVMRDLDDSQSTRVQRRHWLDRCLVRTEELQDIIADWLTLARVEGGTFSRTRGDVDLGTLVSEIFQAHQELAAQEGVSLDARLPSDRCIVHSDRNCLAVLFDNLIVNAIKYNKPNGRVCVTADLSPGEVVVLVTDTGRGIPQEDLPFLFDEFFRAKQHGPPRVRGTGLGLPICRRIASELGATVEVESEEGVGSTFRVRLPAHSPAAASVAHREQSP